MADQDFRNSAFYKELIALSKEQGYVTLLDIVSAVKKHKDPHGDIDAITEALKDEGVQYTESEDSDPDFSEEPSEEDLENFGEEFDEDDIPEDDDESPVEEGPSDEELSDIESEEEGEEGEEAKKSEGDDDDEDEEEAEEEEEEENLNEWKGTDDDTEVSTERFIDISSVSDHPPRTIPSGSTSRRSATRTSSQASRRSSSRCRWRRAATSSDPSSARAGSSSPSSHASSRR